MFSTPFNLGDAVEQWQENNIDARSLDNGFVKTLESLAALLPKRFHIRFDVRVEVLANSDAASEDCGQYISF